MALTLDDVKRVAYLARLAVDGLPADVFCGIKPNPVAANV